MNKWTRRLELNRASAETGGAKGVSHNYFAFLSYSHQDSEEADRLHRDLEEFRIPSSLTGRLTINGVIPKRLTPIFRDRHELAAGQDLTQDIRAALSASRCLIVLCSPAAAKSKWTNTEIEFFKREHPDGCVIAAIVAGDPLAKDGQACFPPALTQKYDRLGRPTGKLADPLGADLRESGDGRRVGLLKIVAGILGVGLDDLVQRDQLRRQRRMAFTSAGSLAGMLIAGALSFTAIQARDAARDQRREAEGLVEFMLGDLKDKLEPIGRLDLLDSVGAKALAYYEKQNTAQLSDESLAQRYKALTLLGSVALDRGNIDPGLRYFRASFEGTAEALRRSPDDPQRLFDHAQNVFYLATIARIRGDFGAAESGIREYKRLAQRMIEIDPGNPAWRMEGIYADNNLGVLLNDQKRFSEAAAIFANSVADRERLLAEHPTNNDYRKALIEALAWLSDSRENEGRLGEALEIRERQIAILGRILESPTADAAYERQALTAYRSVGRINGQLGDAPAAEAALGRALAIGQKLIVAEPANTDWISATALAKFDLGRVAIGIGDVDRAAALTREACDSTDQLVARDSTVISWRLDLRGKCFDARARVALAQRSVDEVRDATASLAQLASAESQSKPVDTRILLADAYLLNGLAERASGNANQANANFQQAWNAWPRNTADNPSSLAGKAINLAALGRKAEAASLAERLRRMNYKEPGFVRTLRSVQ